jgi:hypothetical protein
MFFAGLLQLSFLSTASSTSLLRTTTITVGSGQYAHAASRLPHQRSAFYAAGRYWLFWGANSGIPPYDLNFRSSTDGVTWSADTNIGTFPLVDAQWSVAYDDTNGNVHIARNIRFVSLDLPHDGLEYRRGTPNSDGSIAWDAPWSQVVATGHFVGDFSLAVDSSGQAWVAYGDNGSADPAKGSAIAIRNAATDGAWTNARGFPTTIRAGQSDDAFAVLSSIGDGSMYAITYEWATDAAAMGYTISPSGAIVSEGPFTANTIEADGTLAAKVAHIDQASRDGIVHCAYARSGGTEIRYRQRARDGTFGPEVLIKTIPADVVVPSPRVSFAAPSTVAVIWSTARGEIWTALSRDDGATWSPAVLLQDSVPLETSFEHMMPAALAGSGGLLQLVWLASDYSLRHSLVDIN